MASHADCWSSVSCGAGEGGKVPAAQRIAIHFLLVEGDQPVLLQVAQGLEGAPGLGVYPANPDRFRFALQVVQDGQVFPGVAQGDDLLRGLPCRHGQGARGPIRRPRDQSARFQGAQRTVLAARLLPDQLDAGRGRTRFQQMGKHIGLLGGSAQAQALPFYRPFVCAELYQAIYLGPHGRFGEKMPFDHETQPDQPPDARFRRARPQNLPGFGERQAALLPQGVEQRSLPLAQAILRRSGSRLQADLRAGESAPVGA